jgi:RNA polymerase sigma factor (sigma-70 family)
MNNQTLQQEWDYYYPKVYGYFFRRISNKSDVEDLTAMVLHKFFEVLISPGKSANLTNKNAYLWKIAYNHLADFIQNKQKRPLTIDIEDEFETPDNSIEKFYSKRYQERIPYLVRIFKIEKFYSKRYQERVKNLLKCIKTQVKDLEYKIIEMSFFEELTSIEISKVLNLKPPTIRQKLSRSLKKVREQCKKLRQES